MDRFEIKKTIESLFLSCPYEDRFPMSLITLLEDHYEDCWSESLNREHHEVARFRDNQYFSDTGVSYFITWLAKSHERKIKNMSGKSKATLLAIVCRVATEPSTIIPIHKMISSDVIDYVNKQRSRHV